METRVQYILVGLFVIVLGAGGITISLWLAFGDIATDYRTYRIYMQESVSGLYVDAPVRYHGVEVGKVSALKLDPTNPQQVIVSVAIEEAIPIRTDTVATLKTQGLTGIASIELTGGSVSAPLLEAESDQPPPVIQTAPSLFSRLDNTLSELAGNLNRVTRDVHNILSEANLQAFNATLENLQQVSATLAEERATLTRTLDNADRFFAGAARAGDELPGLMTRIENGAGSLETMARDFAKTSQALRQRVETGGQGLQQVTNQVIPEMQLLMRDLREMSMSMRQLAEEIRDNPGHLIYGGPNQAPGPGEEVR